VAASSSPSSFGNDEDNWFGQDDRLAESRAEQSVAAVGARIIGAKPFPIAARRLEELTRNPKARLEQVVSVLETDPGLSVRLLRLVNSAGYGLKVRVTSVRHAAVLVGTRRLHQVATTAAILDLFEASNETAVELLEHATVVGSLCRYLAVHLGLPHDELFTCGFLHDIGKLMLLDTEGEKYSELVQKYGGGPDQLHIHERRVFGFDHAVLGAHVLSAWNIPEPVPKVVAFHHQPARAMQDPLLASMVQALRLADLMSYAVVLDSDTSGIALVAESEAAKYLEISEPQVAAMWADLRALAERSRARSSGQPDLELVAPRRLDVPRSFRPRRSLAPRSVAPHSQRSSDQPSVSIPLLEGPDPEPTQSGAASSAVAKASVNEVPAHFPCVACSKPSYGNLCAACGGQVCPEHQVGPDHWCVLCLREYDKFRVKKQIPGYLKVTGLALAGFSVGASVTGAMVSQTYSLWKLVVAPLTMPLLWGILLPVAHRLWQRRRFLRTRPKGRVPIPIKLPRPNEVFISSLDANLENEGLMGPSIAPPSQGLISSSGIAIVPATVSEPFELPLPPGELLDGPISAAPQAIRTRPTTDPSPIDDSEVLPSVRVFDNGPPSSERDFDLAAEALERSSEVMPKAEVIVVAAPEPVTSAAPMVSLTPSPAATPSLIASLRKRSEGLSEFPSVSSESELENVVASVSARLGRDLPSNDYMGPSAELRAATIAPIPEVPPSSQTMPGRDVPQLTAVPLEFEPASLPRPSLHAEPAPAEGEAEAEPAPVTAESVAAPVSAESELPQPEPVAVAPELVRATRPAPGPEPEPQPEQVAAAVDAPAPLVFPRVNLEQGCAPRMVFRCAIPIAESCSPAPRRTSLRPNADFATTDGAGPSTLRGLG
jgi:putative nucleotidyltransferase with HDIG domain